VRETTYRVMFRSGMFQLYRTSPRSVLLRIRYASHPPLNSGVVHPPRFPFSYDGKY
jgi:hypothetical protein